MCYYDDRMYYYVNGVRCDEDCFFDELEDKLWETFDKKINRWNEKDYSIDDNLDCFIKEKMGINVSDENFELVEKEEKEKFINKLLRELVDYMSSNYLEISLGLEEYGGEFTSSENALSGDYDDNDFLIY